MKPISIPHFIPSSFNEAFYGSDAIPQQEKKELFHYIFFDQKPNESDILLRSILQGQTGEDYTFLANSCVERRGRVNYRNPRIVSYLIDFLTVNKAEQFYLFLYRIDTIWKDESNSKSMIMKNIFTDFFEHNNKLYSKYELCLDFFSENNTSNKNDNIIEDINQYFQLIGSLHKTSLCFRIDVVMDNHKYTSCIFIEIYKTDNYFQ